MSLYKGCHFKKLTHISCIHSANGAKKPVKSRVLTIFTSFFQSYVNNQLCFVHEPYFST